MNTFTIGTKVNTFLRSGVFTVVGIEDGFLVTVRNEVTGYGFSTHYGNLTVAK